MISLPARLDDAGDDSLDGKLSETNTAKREFADIAAGTPAAFAARVFAHFEFRLSLLFNNQACFSHVSPYDFFVKGSPSSSRSRFACFLSNALVTKVMFIPFTFFTLSNSTSGKIVCS